MRALLVGDPDQAIYEFNGARPEMFDTFADMPGARLLQLSTSLRCPPAVASAASFLKRSDGLLNPDHARDGAAFLVRYENLMRDLPAIAQTVEASSAGAVAKIVTRLNSTVDDLTGRARASVPSLRCRAATLLHRAVQCFRRRKTVTALAAARAAIEQMLMGGEGFSDEDVQLNGIDPRALRGLAIRCILAGNAIPLDGTVLEWQKEALVILERETETFCRRSGRTPRPVTTKPAQCKGYDHPIAHSIADPGATGPNFGRLPVVTVHAVKGETHDVTLFVVPPTATKAAAKRCPSVTWWSGADGDDEERRIAYVALTRSRGDVVLCIDEAAYARLVATQPAFVDTFRVVIAAAFADAWALKRSTRPTPERARGPSLQIQGA
jgi:DNA helicase II / ATP-dependent DNA helicase PcrA